MPFPGDETRQKRHVSMELLLERVPHKPYGVEFFNLRVRKSVST